MSKQEKIAFAFTIIAIAIGLLMCTLFSLQGFSFIGNLSKSDINTSKEMYKMNEAVLLDDIPVWDGALEMTVDNAVLYDSPESAGISSTDALFHTNDMDYENDVAFLICEIEVSNINAKPIYPSYSGNYWFNITFLTLYPYLEITYFDGAPSNRDPSGHDDYCFDLPEGKSHVYKLGFSCSESEIREIEDALQSDSLFLLVSTYPDIQFANQLIELKVEDKRPLK